VTYESVSPAARSIVDHHINGWWFFLVDQESKRSLRMVRREYLDAMAADAEDDEGDEDDEDES
jgi:hypothetical protein